MPQGSNSFKVTTDKISWISHIYWRFATGGSVLIIHCNERNLNLSYVSSWQLLCCKALRFYYFSFHVTYVCVKKKLFFFIYIIKCFQEVKSLECLTVSQYDSLLEEIKNKFLDLNMMNYDSSTRNIMKAK